MPIISLRMNKPEERFIKAYAEANKISVFELLRSSVLEKIEDNIDLELYHQAMKEHQNDPNDISFDKMIKKLDSPPMREYQIRFEKRAQKTLKKMDKHQAGILMAWIKKSLVDTTHPRPHGKGLTADRSREWRYRFGDYRLIAYLDDEAITISFLEIGHRRDIYK